MTRIGRSVKCTVVVNTGLDTRARAPRAAVPLEETVTAMSPAGGVG
ncbi:hypothetical protein KU893_21040 [Nocardioides daeguensis]|nr:hypothetical protein [Nocardioides daeguensis]MBV6729590.1 hypothetical protein [Nocardioides daeguensis]